MYQGQRHSHSPASKAAKKVKHALMQKQHTEDTELDKSNRAKKGDKGRTLEEALAGK